MPTDPMTPVDREAVIEAMVTLGRGARTFVFSDDEIRTLAAKAVDALLPPTEPPRPEATQDGGLSVPTPEDLAYRRGVEAERSQWRKATGAAHWSEVEPTAPTLPGYVVEGTREEDGGWRNVYPDRLATAMTHRSLREANVVSGGSRIAVEHITTRITRYVPAPQEGDKE